MVRKGVICMLAVVVAIAIGAAAAVAGGESPIVVRSGNLILTVNGNTSPRALPSHGLAPISFHASGGGPPWPGGKPLVDDLSQTTVARRFRTRGGFPSR